VRSGLPHNFCPPWELTNQDAHWPTTDLNQRPVRQDAARLLDKSDQTKRFIVVPIDEKSPIIEAIVLAMYLAT
jgi:hypothetical protein